MKKPKSNQQLSVQRLKGPLARRAKKDGTDLRGAMRDLLTDVLHLCAHQQISFDILVEAATEVYNEEADTDRKAL